MDKENLQELCMELKQIFEYYDVKFNIEDKFTMRVGNAQISVKKNENFMEKLNDC